VSQDVQPASVGCRMELSSQTHDLVLRYIPAAVLGMQRLTNRVRRFPQDSQLPLTLANFLHIHPNVSLGDIYKRATWTELKQRAFTNQVADSSTDSLFNTYAKAINNQIGRAHV